MTKFALIFLTLCLVGCESDKPEVNTSSTVQGYANEIKQDNVLMAITGVLYGQAVMEYTIGSRDGRKADKTNACITLQSAQHYASRQDFPLADVTDIKGFPELFKYCGVTR